MSKISKEFLSRFKSGSAFVRRESSTFAIFLPGSMLIAAAVIAILMPRLIIALLASILLAFGILSCFVAYKFLVLRKKFQELSKHMEGKVVVRTMVHPEPQTFSSSNAAVKPGLRIVEQGGIETEVLTANDLSQAQEKFVVVQGQKSSKKIILH